MSEFATGVAVGILGMLTAAALFALVIWRLRRMTAV